VYLCITGKNFAARYIVANTGAFFVLSMSTATLSHNKPVPARTSHENCGTHGQNKTGQLYFRAFYSPLCNVGYYHKYIGVLGCALKLCLSIAVIAFDLV
jgi:hypothetical protein